MRFSAQIFFKLLIDNLLVMIENHTDELYYIEIKKLHFSHYCGDFCLGESGTACNDKKRKRVSSVLYIYIYIYIYTHMTTGSPTSTENQTFVLHIGY